MDQQASPNAPTNPDRNSLEIEKLRVEISKLMAETARLASEVGKINNESAKIEREAAKIVRETYWYPVVVAGSIIGGTAAVLTAIVAIASKILG